MPYSADEADTFLYPAPTPSSAPAATTTLLSLLGRSSGLLGGEKDGDLLCMGGRFPNVRVRCSWSGMLMVPAGVLSDFEAEAELAGAGHCV